MDTELLKTFLEVRNTRHFGRAADNLYLTQAAVSARVRQLEELLGVKLFLRVRNNIQLSVEGERFVPHAESMLALWERARQEVALNEQFQQQVLLGSTQGLWHYVLRPCVAQIASAMRSLSLHAEVHSSESLLRMVSEGSLDAAVVYDPPGLPELSRHALGKLKLSLLSTESDLTVSQALAANYVYVDWGLAFNIFHAESFGEVSEVGLRTNMASLAEDYMASHGGAAFLPKKLLPSGSDFYPVKNARDFSRNVFFIYKTNTEKSVVLEKLIALIKKRF